jgi:tRNA threonylcarbamoyladenosine biosynthesis protein TsaE
VKTVEFKKYISKNIKTTHKIAQTILEELMLDINHAQQALIVILKGELGTGKTEFVKGLKDFLNIKSNVLSPTFVVMKVYDINKNNSVFKKLYHFDLYRLINNQTHNLNIDNDLANISIQDVFNNPSNIVFVE